MAASACQTITEPVHIVDWLPTLAAVTRQLGGKTCPPDGVDLSPVLFGSGKLPERDPYWIRNSKSSRWALRHGDWKIVRYNTQEPTQANDWQLFNLKDDPKEKYNIAAAHPEILAQLHERFLQQCAMDLK